MPISMNISTLWNTYRHSGFPGGSAGKESAWMWEIWVWSLGWEDPLEKGNVTQFIILAWRIPCTLYGPWGRKELDMTERLHFTFH